MHTLIEPSTLGVLLTMVGVAAITDFRTGLIPNRVVAIGAAAGVVVQLLAVVLRDVPLLDTLGQMALGLLVCSLVPLAMYLAGALGGGDLKLFAAIGLCVGPSLGLDIQLWAHLLAVAILPVYLIRRGGLGNTLRNTARLLANAFLPAHKRWPIERTALTSFRFAPAIFGATVWVALLDGARP